MIHRAALIACLLLVPGIAVAAAAGVSTWTVAGGSVTLRYTFPQSLAARLAPRGTAVPPMKRLSAYVLAHARVEQQGVPCPAVDQGYDLGTVDARYAGPGLESFEILFGCPRATGALLLRNDAFFELAPAQIGIADLRVNAAPVVTRVLTANDPAIRIGAGATPAPSGAATYGWLGIRHALGTALCLGTALGLALLAHDRRAMLLAAGGLCGGYLLAGLAAGTGGLLLEPRAAQATAGLLLALFAAQLAARSSTRPGVAAAGLAVTAALCASVALASGHGNAALALAGAGLAGVAVIGLQRWAMAGLAALLIQAGFAGLLDGFSLAVRFAPLREFHIFGTGRLLAYDLGTLLGMLAIAAATIVVRGLLQRHAAPARARLGRDLLAAVLAGLGAWSMLAS